MRMSNAIAIAAVTAVLKDLLENGLVSDSITTSVGDVIVTALPPDRISVGTDERAQLNLFLYQVTQNRNVDWVSRELRSDHRLPLIKDPRSKNPPLALDLHYLLTVYGAKDFQAEILLGYAMQLLHEMPVLTHDIIHTALKNASTVSTGVLSQALAGVSVSELTEQVGQIKICPEFFNMEETSKLWSVLQTQYRPSVAYQASMVLIDSRSSNKPVEPYVMPFAQPIIEQVIAPAEALQLIVAGSTLVIRGKRLRGDLTRVRLGGIETLLVPQDVQEKQISLSLPNLYAGVQGVQVVHTMMGTTTMPHHQVESNVAAFVLHPMIAASVDQVQGSGNALRANITVKFSPKVGKGQRVVLLLNEVSSSGAIAYSFAVAPRTDDTDRIAIPIKDVKVGTYIVRVQVDGAQSPLSMNQSGEYDSPQVTIP